MSCAPPVDEVQLAGLDQLAHQLPRGIRLLAPPHREEGLRMTSTPAICMLRCVCIACRTRCARFRCTAIGARTWAAKHSPSPHS